MAMAHAQSCHEILLIVGEIVGSDYSLMHASSTLTLTLDPSATIDTAELGATYNANTIMLTPAENIVYEVGQKSMVPPYLMIMHPLAMIQPLNFLWLGSSYHHDA